jgi:hypothetical protein
MAFALRERARLLLVRANTDRRNDAAGFTSCCGLVSCSAPLRTRPLDHARGHCYRGPWRLPGPDSHRLAALSLSIGYVITTSTSLLSWRPTSWTHPPIAGRGANAVECLGAPAEIRIGDSDIAEVVGSLRGSRCGASEISLLDRTRHRFARLADCRPNHREVVFSVPAHIGATPLGKTGIGSLTHSELSNLWRPKADQ